MDSCWVALARIPSPVVSAALQYCHETATVALQSGRCGVAPNLNPQPRAVWGWDETKRSASWVVTNVKNMQGESKHTIAIGVLCILVKWYALRKYARRWSKMQQLHPKIIKWRSIWRSHNVCSVHFIVFVQLCLQYGSWINKWMTEWVNEGRNCTLTPFPVSGPHYS